MFERILMAVDGSEHLGSVVARVIELATASKSEVRVLNVHEVGWSGRSAPVARRGDQGGIGASSPASLANSPRRGCTATGAVRQSSGSDRPRDSRRGEGVEASASISSAPAVAPIWKASSPAASATACLHLSKHSGHRHPGAPLTRAQQASQAPRAAAARGAGAPRPSP